MRGADSLWTKLAERPVLPISLALVGLLLVGWLNWQMFAPFSRPVLVGDEKGFLATYDLSWSSELDRGAFQLRESRDGERWSSPIAASGKVSAAALKGERFFLLFEDFVGEYERRDQSRLRCHDLSAWDARFSALEPCEDGLLAFGVDDHEALLALRINDSGVALRGRVEAATGRSRWVDVEDSRSLFGGRAAVAELKSGARAPKVQISTARVASETFALLLVPPTPPASSGFSGPASRDEGSGQKNLRWLRAAPSEGGELSFSAIDESLGKAVAACLVLEGQALRLYRVADVNASAIEQWTLVGAAFQKSSEIKIEKNGLFQSQRVWSLAGASSLGKQLLLAQLGGTLCIYSGGEKGEWRAMAQLPGEAWSLAYAWLGAVLGLSLLLVVSGLRSLRAQTLSWPDMSVPQLKEELRGIVELSHREAARRSRPSESGPEAAPDAASEAQGASPLSQSSARGGSYPNQAASGPGTVTSDEDESEKPREARES